MAEAVFFYLFATLMLCFAVAVVLHKHPIYSVLSLLVVMFSLAGLFIMLGAYFLAAIQILLYAGAVLVLFLFVMMLLNLKPDSQRRKWLGLPLASCLASAVLLVIFVYIYSSSPSTQIHMSELPAVEGDVASLGRLLFQEYLLPFELVSFIILTAILGAVSLAKQERKTQ